MVVTLGGPGLGILRLEKFTAVKSAQADALNSSGAVSISPAKPSPDSPTVSSDNQRASPMSAVEIRLSEFLAQHHAKSSRGDVDGLVADYANRVDHFTNGYVDRDFIRKDELDYHSPGTRVTETMTTRPEFNLLNGTTYAATYSIAFHRVRPDGRWTKGNSDIEMDIDLTPNGPRIVRHHAKIRDQQKGP